MGEKVNQKWKNECDVWMNGDENPVRMIVEFEFSVEEIEELMEMAKEISRERGYGDEWYGKYEDFKIQGVIEKTWERVREMVGENVEVDEVDTLDRECEGGWDVEEG